MKNLPQIREISTLSFNERVLQEAEDRRNPLLERLKFLGIFSSNMDEFYKVRVASIQRRLDLGERGMRELLEVISEKTRNLDDRFREAYADIVAELAREGVRILNEEDVAKQPPQFEAWLRNYFQQEVLPRLVPMICQKGRPFPTLIDGALYIGIVMATKNNGSTRKTRYAILEIPRDLPRFVQAPGGDIMYLDDVIRYQLNEIFYIFPYDTIHAYEFKISRDAELDIDNDFSEGYVRKMERVLRQRKGGRPTRFVYDEHMDPGLLRYLLRELDLSTDDPVIPGGRYHQMRDLMAFPSKRKDLLFPPLNPAPHPVLDRARAPMLDLIAKQDLLITYPYQSFDHLIRLLREAAIDPLVESIKISLYRSARNSQVVNALCNAARNGKRIVVNIELQARFDEKNNIKISERLREEGAEVIYGVPPMKVHSKFLLIERKKRLIAGLSTGNFNETTGELYVDSVLLTADKRLTAEVDRVFQYLENASRLRTVTAPKFRHLLVSPFNTRKRLLQLIAREEAKGPAGHIFMKVNHLTDERIIQRLLKAADAGVRMDLVVRTTYALRPHPNIRAISILDRFLEHQRCYIFGRGNDRAIFMSSADLMERNLDWRVEVAFPIYHPELQQQVADMMAIQVADTMKARILDETQSNQYVQPHNGGIRAQEETYQYLLRLYEHGHAVPAAATA